MPEPRDYVVSALYPMHPSFKATFHGLFSRKSAEYAKSIDRELAYGPPQLISDPEHYGPPVLLWPLVQEVENGVSGETVPPL